MTQVPSRLAGDFFFSERDKLGQGQLGQMVFHFAQVPSFKVSKWFLLTHSQTHKTILKNGFWKSGHKDRWIAIK